MIDSVINGTGNSRYLRTSLGADTTWDAALAMLRAGTFPIDLAGINAAGFATVGTPLNAANLLKDAVITALGLDADATPSDAWEAVLELIGKATTYSAPVTLTAAGWSGSGPWTQTVSIPGYSFTAGTIVDLVCDQATASAIAAQGVAQIYLQNNGGTLTAYATGAAPASNITVTALIYETTAT